MDWIEQLFGIAPDGGNGSVELMLLVVPLLCGALLVRMRKRGSGDRQLFIRYSSGTLSSGRYTGKE